MNGFIGRDAENAELNSLYKQKCALIQVKRGYTIEKALISRFGADKALQELEYFQHILSAEDLF